jgi:7-alpha-hydroxysteroid dehydrogenase
MKSRLVGQTAVVTGASRGIGRAIAEAFGREGANVVVAARTVEQYDERLPGSVHDTVDAIVSAGGQALAVACDVSDDADRIRLIESARDAYGTVDILVNNAALTVPGRPGRPVPSGPTGVLPPFVDVPVKAFRIHFEIGVFAAYRLMQLALPDMISRGSGAIINISSEAGHVPGEGPYPADAGPVLAGYGGNKIALEHLTQSVALEVGPLGIAANVLLPSIPVASPGLDALGGYDGEDPAAFAEAAVQLASADPTVWNGMVWYHHDLLDPTSPRRKWRA